MGLLETLQRAFAPEFFGDCDAATRDRRLKGYITEAQAKTQTKPEGEEAKLEAQEAFSRSKAYGDAFDYWLGQAESTSVDSEGSTNMGDLMARVKLLGYERDRWKGIFDGLLVSPSVANPQKNPASGYLPVEVIW